MHDHTFYGQKIRRQEKKILFLWPKLIDDTSGCEKKNEFQLLVLWAGKKLSHSALTEPLLARLS